MHVLLTGAGGIIGSHLVAALLREGYEITAAVRNPDAIRRRSPGIRTLRADFSQLHRPDQWAPLLAGIDAVVNAVGIIRETGSQRFRDLHWRAPAALFAAASLAGVRRVVQISALGADASALSPYQRSKRAADDFLATTDLDWVVLRPSIVFGAGALSTELFTAMAALPVTPLLERGEQRIQPIHIADLVWAVMGCLRPGGPSRTRIDLVGPEPIGMRALLERLRHWLGLGPLRTVAVPYRLMLALAWMGGLLGLGPLTADTVRMLQRGNTGDVEALQRHFGFMPHSLDTALLEAPARRPDRWHAGLYFLRPLLRASIALVWILAGVASAFLYPVADSLQLLARVGIAGDWALLTLYGAATLDILLGLAMFSNRLLRPAAFMQLAVMGLYTLIISLALPELWLHPFGPVTKNLPLAVATLCLVVLEGDR